MKYKGRRESIHVEDRRIIDRSFDALKKMKGFYVSFNKNFPYYYKPIKTNENDEDYLFGYTKNNNKVKVQDVVINKYGSWIKANNFYFEYEKKKGINFSQPSIIDNLKEFFN
jgi:hypothetical protein